MQYSKPWWIEEENSSLLLHVTIAEHTRWHLWRHACLVCLWKCKRSVDWPLVTNQNSRYTSQENFARHIWPESEAVQLSSTWNVNHKITVDLKRRRTIFYEGNVMLPAKTVIQTLCVAKLRSLHDHRYMMLVSTSLVLRCTNTVDFNEFRCSVASFFDRISLLIRFLNLVKGKQCYLRDPRNLNSV